MKKTTFLFTLVLISLLSLKCDSNQGTTNPNDVVLNYNEASVKWVTNSTLKTMKEIYQSKYNNPKDTIQRPNNEMGKVDSDRPLYIDFDLESIKALVWEMETAANKAYKKGEEKPKMGIRLYHTTYPSDEVIQKTKDLEGVKKENANANTIVLAPVFDDGTGYKKFDPRAQKKLDGPFNTYKWAEINPNKDKSSGGTKSLMMFYYQALEGDGSNLNHGDMCQPFCSDEQ